MALDIIIDSSTVSSAKVELILHDFSYAKVLSKSSLKGVLNAANTKQFWLVVGDGTDDFDFGTEPDEFDKAVKFKAFCISNGSPSIILCNRMELMKLTTQKKIESISDIHSLLTVETFQKSESAIKDATSSIILLSYYEPQASAKFDVLHERFGNRVKHVKNVPGIVDAHYTAANVSGTEFFFIVDADADVLDTFNFDYYPSDESREFVHVWRSQNPLNGLTYGYGGVKLFSRAMFNKEPGKFIDLTTSISMKGTIVLEEISNVTRFNIDALSTWRSAFRECAKLASKTIHGTNEKETNYRLNTWLTTASGDFDKYCLHGARAGNQFGIKFQNDPIELNRINDFEWLATEFRSYFGL